MIARWTIRVVTVAAAMIFLIPALFAQSKTPNSGIGLAASIQDGQFDIMVPIWLGERFTLAPVFGIAWAEDAGSELRIGVAPRYYLRKDVLSPYLGLRVGALINSPADASSTTDIIIGAASGGEYFFSEYFSLGVEAQANLAISDSKSVRFGNPGKLSVNTGAAVIAGVYF